MSRDMLPDERDPVTGQYPGGIIETKEFFRASEFWMAIAAIFFLVIAASAMDTFDGEAAARWSSLIVVAYIVSRGVAKAGSAHPFWGRQMPDFRMRGSDQRARMGEETRVLDMTDEGRELRMTLHAIETRLERLERARSTPLGPR